MTSSVARVYPMKDLEIITTPNTVKILFEKTRSTIIFRYLVNGAMTVKQLADALGKNPGTILHHIEKLKEVGLVVEERTETTVTGIVQRYYRASAREYRLGLSNMMEQDNGVAKFARDRLQSMIRGLEAYGIHIGEPELDEATAFLKDLIERENIMISNIPILDEETWQALPPPLQRDTARLIRRFTLDTDPTYLELKHRWNTYLKNHHKSSEGVKKK